MQSTFERYTSPANLPRTLVFLVVGTGLLSMILGATSGSAVSKTLVDWLKTYLSDLSSDLIGAWFLMIFMRFTMLRQPLLPDEVIDSPQPIPTVKTAEVAGEVLSDAPTLPSLEIEQATAELKTAATAEARQLILNRLRSGGISLQKVTWVDMELSGANLAGVSLQNADLTKTRLRSADLQGCNLRGANLYMTQLIEANLHNADLSNARLERTFLSGAKLSGARLQGATIQTSLWGVDLQNADLREADLSGAELFRTNLRGANLVGVQLTQAKINHDTILPDGQNWEPRTDMGRFTNPDHPQFWRPSNSEDQTP
jgi:uncharacterized protein YjbI with pentapeptide repeats